MIIKQLENSSIRLPAIGQGMGSYIGDDSQVDVLRAGIDLGMNFIDTAEIYDDGRSEEIIGKAIKGLRERVIIGTKFSPEHNAKADVLMAVEGSLKRLQTDYIDLYQLHWQNPSVLIGDTISAMVKLVKEGKVRFIGVCNHNLRELREFNNSLPNVLLATLQVEYNLFDRVAEEDILPYCQSQRIIVIAYSPLDQGRVADGLERRQKLKQIAHKYNKTLAQIALAWLIKKDGIVAIPRSKSIKHIQENAAVADFNIDEQDMREIDIIFERPVIRVAPEKIRVSFQGENNRLAYRTVEEAMENRLGHVPSPLELSKSILIDKKIKPIRLIPTLDKSGKYEYDLVEGMIRYWAWVIAYGNALMPAYIRED